MLARAWTRPYIPFGTTGVRVSLCQAVGYGIAQRDFRVAL